MAQWLVSVSSSCVGTLLAVLVLMGLQQLRDWIDERRSDRLIRSASRRVK